MRILGKIQLPGDKSMAHRAIMLASISKGECNIYNSPKSRDVSTTIDCLRSCGVEIKVNQNSVKILGSKIKTPRNILNCNNSGTTARLLMGLLSGKKILADFSGDESLIRRPMDRVIEPLRQMGVDIASEGNCLPAKIIDIDLKNINYTIPVQSAQVKSAIILASLGCNGISRIEGEIHTRDHLERMISHISSDGIISNHSVIEIYPNKININSFDIKLPGDVSSASFFIALACIAEGSRLVIDNLLINKHRSGLLETLKSMGANIVIDNIKSEFNESQGRVTVVGDRKLSACKISPSKITSMIDELPILALVCAYTNGVSTIEGMKELKYKESNRYDAIFQILIQMGVDISEYGDNGMIIRGENKLYNTNNLKPSGDHRIAMMISIAQALSGEDISYDDCIDMSFPEFKSIMQGVIV